MFNPLKGLGNLTKLQQQAMEMQKALKQEQVVVEKDGIQVIMRGDQQVQQVTIDGVLENRVVEAINEAVKKTQEMAARKLLEMSQNEQA